MKNIKLFRLILIFAVSVLLGSSQVLATEAIASGAIIVDRYLNNEDCKSGVTHRSWEESYERWTSEAKPASFGLYREEMYQFIVLHYTGGISVSGTYDTYNARGVSAHYTLDNDGTIFHTVNEISDIAYHAGVSYFARKTGLNYYSIGIEHSNPGFSDEEKIFAEFRKPVQLSGDLRWWYPFSEPQFESSMQLTRDLQREYKIPGWYVVTHADIAPSRKSDIGPLWDYKRSFEGYGVGFFPSESHAVDLARFSSLSDADYLQLIGALGYDARDRNVVQAYQFHFSSRDISGILGDATKEDILRHVVAVYDHVDSTTGQRFEFFRDRFTEWATLGKALAFREYIAFD